MVKLLALAGFVSIGMLHGTVNAAPVDAPSGKPSHHLDGMIKCSAANMECTIPCGKNQVCTTATHENQFRLKMHGFIVKCDEKSCSMQCTSEAKNCPWGVLRHYYRQKFEDDGELDFSSGLDGAAKEVTDKLTGFYDI